MTPNRPAIAPYGTWKSPITSDLIASGSIRLGGLAFDGDEIYWVEGRPSEGGRNVLVRRQPDGTTADVTPQDYNVRSRVHEYGGGAFVVDNGVVYFSNVSDGRIYRQPLGETPQPLTPEGAFRYADFVVDRSRDRLLCVREDHSGEGEPENTLVTVGFDGSVEVLVSGCDFYASPALSPDGNQLAWLSWNHPNMPWDGTQLWLADIDDNGKLSNGKTVTGGANESVFQPQWSPNGTLYFASDRASWWNLYRLGKVGVEPLFPLNAEFATPQWVFGMSTYAFLGGDRLICAYTQQGMWQMATLNLGTKRLQNLETPYTQISSVRGRGDRVAFLGSSPTESSALVLMDVDRDDMKILRRSSDLEVDPSYISKPEAIEFPTENGQTAYGFFYPPTNPDYQAPDGEKPPLLVKSHSGPTASASTGLRLSIQYWTSRGFGFLEVNYGGSTGYGRDYRQRLDGNWGVVDVDDCANGAKYLVDRGLVDGDRLAITGSSAGGYTVLCALTFRDTFKAGASYYGVSNLETWAADTHKFELRYIDRLVGPYPERKDVYEARSPIHFVDRLSCPTIFFHGLEDTVVPPSQAEQMVEALRKKGLPVAYVPFEGERHGFRQAETIKRALDAEFYFYSRVFGYEPADDIEPVEIENLDS
ncbi:S9 family peptidase [Baaleninema simplex]|uniref:S9 family peptidase n=1 Tax=Baaleninema simplex TaxID=2862350 RepID=UPI00034AAC1D|nr:S9 family peptidase [Baaleninema simplex]